MPFLLKVSSIQKYTFTLRKVIVTNFSEGELANLRVQELSGLENWIKASEQFLDLNQRQPKTQQQIKLYQLHSNLLTITQKHFRF